MGARPEETPVDQRDCGLLLSPREHRLISLLWAGHTDASAAHRMGISPRTVTNILRSLMDRTGVNNRFQLGVVLGSHFALRHTPDMRAPDDGACQDTSREEYCPVGSVVGMA